MYRYVLGIVNFNIDRPDTVFFKLEKTRTLSVDIETVKTLSIELGNVQIGETHDTYEGEYVIIPRVYQQTMDTNDKLMDGDVYIRPIPLTKVSNIKGGKTATIG